MNRQQITRFINDWSDERTRTLVIIDFANVEKWRESLGWRVGVAELCRLIKNFTSGNKQLRRFYYGSDYGQRDNSTTLTPWSHEMTTIPKYNNLEVVTKRVKYIHDTMQPSGFIRKCDLDVEMAVDIIKYQADYDNIILFSGDGDLVYALDFVKNLYGKRIFTFGARDHIGREVIDAYHSGLIEKIFYAEDFEYRLSMDRRR